MSGDVYLKSRQQLVENKRFRRPDTSHIPSLDSGLGNTSKSVIKRYTGDKIKGIGVLHKSNLVPVFSKEEAEDQAKMR